MVNSTNFTPSSINSTGYTPVSVNSTEFLPQQVSDYYDMATVEYNDSSHYYDGYSTETPPLSTNWTAI
jgi:hypothetical protein